MPQESIHKPPDYRQEIVLLDGRQAVIRPITPKDKEALRILFTRLSPDTRYLRFHYSKCELSEDELDCFCNVDYYDTFGLVAEMCRDGKKEIVGIGRYNRLPDYNTAEVAFVVEDREQGKGIGTHLLKELSALAWERGIVNFVAELLSDNVKMMSILRKYDPKLCQVVDGSSRFITLSVK